MPKDATKNVDRYKVRGGKLNEFEYTRNQEAFAEDKRKRGGGKLIPGTPPEEADEGLQPAVAAATTKRTNQPQKGTKSAKKKTVSGSSKRGSAKKK